MDWTQLGLVIQPDSGLPEPDIIDVTSKLMAKYNVVINSGKVAEMVRPYCRSVISRIKTDAWNDDNFDLNVRDIRAFARKLHNESPTGSILYGGNEPGVRASLVTASDVFMDECEKLGRLACIHNFSPIYPPDVSDLAILKPNYERALAAGHLVGSHDAYFDRHWTAYGVSRYMWLKNVLMGGVFPEVVFTEGGCVYGWKPHRGYRWGPTPLTDDEFADELIKEAHGFNEINAAICIFVMSRDHDGNIWKEFVPRRRVYERLWASPVIHKEANEVIYKWKEGFVVKTRIGSVNVRSSHAIGNNVITTLAVNEADPPPITFSEELVTGSGYSWYPVLWNGKVAYVAHKNLALGHEIATISEDAGQEELDWNLPVNMAYYKLGDGLNAKRNYGYPHEGLDFLLQQRVIEGVLVYAMGGGRVIGIRDHEGSEREDSLTKRYGNYVLIETVSGGRTYRSWYCHLATPLVAVGDEVQQGTIIGITGSTGNSDRDHLHLTIQLLGYGMDGYALPDIVDPLVLLTDLA